MKNTYKRNFTYTLIALTMLYALPYTLEAQITFEKVYPTVFEQSGKDMLPTDDGGYIIAASTTNNKLNDIDVYIVKINSTGDIQWTKTYGGSKPDYPNSILKTSDGNYFIVGYTQSFSTGDYNTYLLKIDPAGDTLWTRVYGGYGNEDGKEIVATSDGNYVIVGASNSLNYTNNDMELIKIDPNGNVIWVKNYGGPNYESARSVKQCSDGGFIVAGKTISTIPGKASIYLVKTNAAGDTSWTRTFSGGPNSYEAKFVLTNSDGSYTLCVDDSSAGRDSDVKVIKVDMNGNKIVDKTYGGLDKDICKMIQPTSDGGYIISGISRSFGWDNPDIWLIKLDAACDTMWTSHFGSIGHEHAYAARQTADGGYIALGHTRSFSPNFQMMVVKINQNGKLGLVSVEEFAMNTIINVYPNPTDGIVKIDMSRIVSAGSHSTFKINNALGQEVFSELIAGTDTRTIDLQGNAPGIYFVTIQSTLTANGSEAYSTTQKLILK